MDETALNNWHAAINQHDLNAAQRSVIDPVVVNGPQGAGRISSSDFAAWIERSGISMRPVSWHPVSERLTVVEQHATWPDDVDGARVATCFLTSRGRVAAALRYPTLREALDMAYVLSEVLENEKAQDDNVA